MILLWFLFGILLAFGIARYEQSNKLFWTLAIALTLGYAGTKMCSHVFGDESKSKTIQMYPTQAQVDSVDICLLGTDYQLVSALSVTGLDPVGKDYASGPISEAPTQELVCGEIRDQQITVPTNPPELCLRKSISTLHDGLQPSLF